MIKKIFIASSVVFAVLLVFWGVYNFAFKVDTVEKTKTDKTDKKDPVINFESEKPLLGEKIKDISGEKVIAPIFDKEKNRIIFYAALDGRVFSTNLDGSGKGVLSSQVLPGLFSVKWSNDHKKVLSEFDNGARKYAYNYETRINKQLNDGVLGPVWSNLGDKIFYQYSSENVNELSVADPDGSNWKKIADLALGRIRIAPVPQTSVVTFWNYPRSGEESSLFSVGILGGEAKKIFGGKFGADYLWSPDGKKALVSFVESQNGTRLNSGVVDLDGSNFRELGIPTFASKCAWSGDGKNIFCALPAGVPEGAVVPDGYQDRKFKTQDTFWSVDMESGEKERLIELEELSKIGVSFDAENLFLSASERMLFFINRTDGHLYRIDLPKRSNS